MLKISITQKQQPKMSTMLQTMAAAAVIGINQDGSQVMRPFLQKQILSQES
jgi:hypothetical protein